MKYYNDIYLYCLRERKWKQLIMSEHGSKPAPRSSACLAIYNDTLFVHGKYIQKRTRALILHATSTTAFSIFFITLLFSKTLKTTSFCFVFNRSNTYIFLNFLLNTHFVIKVVLPKSEYLLKHQDLHK